jgi:hypothetical protein
VQLPPSVASNISALALLAVPNKKKQNTNPIKKSENDFFVIMGLFY